MFDGITEVANAPILGLLAAITIIMLLGYREVLRFNQKNVESSDVRSDATIKDWKDAFLKLEGKVDKITELYHEASQQTAKVLSELSHVRQELEAVRVELGKKDVQLEKLEKMFAPPMSVVPVGVYAP